MDFLVILFFIEYQTAITAITARVTFIGITPTSFHLACTAFEFKMEGSEEEWGPVQEAYYHKQGFFAINPFAGCDYILSSAVT